MTQLLPGNDLPLGSYEDSDDTLRPTESLVAELGGVMLMQDEESPLSITEESTYRLAEASRELLKGYFDATEEKKT